MKVSRTVWSGGKGGDEISKPYLSLLKREDDSLKSQQKQKRLFDILTEFAKEVMKLGIEVLLWTWDIKDGKGLDDLLQHRKLPFQINLRTGERKLVDLKQLYEVA
ncbi:hypothetical protein [Bacillus infantis]|uniref:hypothetical protein n=1 Tax=Bacillus infantis TaxID=324767 RepID=UPI0020A14B4B|nr:hypothetical protein [Bacillus infantis]MCP1161400.1 hypothetical protein [Bacillus infantis]